jgi:3-phosphoinositide dependent protein kinase-1
MELYIQKTLSQSSNLSTTSSSSSSNLKRSPGDFEFGRVLGEGSFSTVIYAEEPAKKRSYAIKVLDKRHIIKEKKVKYVTIEKDVLNKLQHPFVIKLYYTFQDTASLYFVTEYCPNGDLLGLLREKGRFDFLGARFYIAELIKGVEYIHSESILHRDIKPENILLDHHYHIKIADFGSAKILDSEPTPTQQDPARRASFVGTAEYCSPELLNEKIASFASDVWAIGCTLYQMLVGIPPFKGTNEYQTFQKIINLNFVLPEELEESAKSLISEILVIDPLKRIELQSIPSTSFFTDFEWNELEKQNAPKMSFLEPLAKFEMPRLEYTDLPDFDSDFDLSDKMNQMTFQSPLKDVTAGSLDSIDDEWIPSREPCVLKFGKLRKVI